MKLNEFLKESIGDKVYMLVINSPYFNFYKHDHTVTYNVRVFSSDATRAEFVKTQIIAKEYAEEDIFDDQDDPSADPDKQTCLERLYDDNPKIKNKIDGMTTAQLFDFFNSPKMKDYGFEKPLSSHAFFDLDIDLRLNLDNEPYSSDS